MARPITKNHLPNLQDAIKETAWKLIAEFGAPALSLRAAGSFVYTSRLRQLAR